MASWGGGQVVRTFKLDSEVKGGQETRDLVRARTGGEKGINNDDSDIEDDDDDPLRYLKTSYTYIWN